MHVFDTESNSLEFSNYFASEGGLYCLASIRLQSLSTRIVSFPTKRSLVLSWQSPASSTNICLVLKVV